MNLNNLFILFQCLLTIIMNINNLRDCLNLQGATANT